MNLQGRDLKLDLSGDDVRQLQSEIAPARPIGARC